MIGFFQRFLLLSSITILLALPTPAFAISSLDDLASREMLQKAGECFLRLFDNYSRSEAEDSYVFEDKTTDARIELVLLNAAKDNAFAVPGKKAALGNTAQIVFTRPLLRRLQEDEQGLAFVIAHEMAHIQQEHFPPNFPLAFLTQEQKARIDETHRQWELEADEFAQETLMKAGFGKNSGLRILSTFSDKSPKISHTLAPRHPMLETRFSQLRLLNLIHDIEHQISCTPWERVSCALNSQLTLIRNEARDV